MIVPYGQGERAKPIEMFGRKIAGIVDAVALKRLFAAVSPPIHEIAIRAVLVGGANQHIVMVAAKTDEAFALIHLPPDQKIQHTLAVRASVDVIADKDELSIPCGAESLTGSEKRLQLVEAAVNITNGKRE